LRNALRLTVCVSILMFALCLSVRLALPQESQMTVDRVSTTCGSG
jgi:hypothetical protein